MKQLEADLWQTSVYQSSMLNSHAYLLRTRLGNILFYNTNNQQDLSEITELGGIDYQMLSHRDEANHSLTRIKQQFNSMLSSSKLEAPYINKYQAVDNVFNAVDYPFANIHIIHTPGHTDGSVCFYYQSPQGKNYLFTGDTLLPWGGIWSTLVVGNAGGSISALMSSLNKLKLLQPDYVLSSSFVGDFDFAPLAEGEWQKTIARKLSKLQQEVDLLAYQQG